MNVKHLERIGVALENDIRRMEDEMRAEHSYEELFPSFWEERITDAKEALRLVLKGDIK